MNPKIRRTLITIAVFAVVAGIAAIIILGKGQEQAQRSANDPAPITGMLKDGEKSGADAKGAVGATGAAAAAGADAAKPAGTTDASKTAEGAPQMAAGAPILSARPVPAPVPAAAPAKLGSLDPTKARFELTFTRNGAGVSAVAFSEYWRTAADARLARAYWKAAVPGSAGNAAAQGAAAPGAVALPDEAARYTIVPAGTLQGFEVPLLAARVLEVDGQEINLYGMVWSEAAPGVFTAEIVDKSDAPQLRVTRRWGLTPDSFDLTLEQRVQNLGSAPHTVRWVQFGPGDLLRDANELVDTRRYQAGYLMSAERDPAQQTVIAHGATLDHSAVVKQVDAGDFLLWPTARQKQEQYGLSWFGATNRYFSLAVHAPYAPPANDSKLAAPAIADIRAQTGDLLHDGKAERAVFTEATSAPVVIAPGQSASFDMGVFAGPLDRSLLSNVQPYAALNMQGLILYLMSGCCSWCTFSWLADFLVWFLGFLANHVVFDWGLAIIVLVIVVRLVLHPLTRRAQISMQRVTRQMAAIKPEMEALQRRYKDEPKKLQEETMALYRARGVNPLGCAGGMLPTFAQMPIWIALYAVLYFAFELRQQPAFFGVFQNFGGWGFLADLSAQDHFFPLPVSLNLYILQLSSINLIPVLMGVVFYIQQKYMSPPPSPNTTPEQEQQQKIMKWMMVILFPFMLYNAPSGLTLYIATSTMVGILESRRIKAEVDKMDLTKPVQRSGGGWLRNAYENAMKRAQAAQQQKAKAKSAPSKKFKDR